MVRRQSPVGIFGGTFDPIHIGHLRSALELAERLSLAEVLMIPSAAPPHRPAPGASAAHRLAMLQRALREVPLLRVEACELHRVGPSYMVDTLIHLRQRYGEQRPLCLLVGGDAFLGLPRWSRWRTLLELAHIVVMRRPGWSLRAADRELQPLLDAHGWGADPVRLQRQPAGVVVTQEVTELGISASAIRALLAAGRSPRFLIPNTVLDYIETHQLYQRD